MDVKQAFNTSSQAFPGNDFSNNIFTDLAPLLTLFGDQITKQFLSMSMGWGDNALIAICPIGILTVMVSAVRIGGATKLKTLIGRARESRATAELELLSATSGEVCEMWSGSEIVRVAGQPSITQYILDKTVGQEPIMTLSEALNRNVYLQSSNQTDQKSLIGAPSLTINVQSAISSPWQLFALVIIGIVVQLMALVLSAIIVYDWSWTAGSEMLSSYGFPCYLVGTLLLSTGLLGCSRVIQNNSRIEQFSPRNYPAQYQPICVQKACTVDAKHFPSLAILHPQGQPVIKVSRSNEQDYSFVTLCSTLVALLGYVCQFVGLRAMHWSIALIQLGATLTMTCARAFLRRGLAHRPNCYPLPMGTDAAGLAYLFSVVNAWELPTFSDSEDINPKTSMSSLSHVLGDTAANSNPSSSLILTARGIGVNVPAEYPTDAVAQHLVNAVYIVMEIYSRRQADGSLNGNPFDCDEHCWAIQPLLRMDDGKVDQGINTTFLCSSLAPRKSVISKAARENSALIADPETISAMLSLWLAVLARRHSLGKAGTPSTNETGRRSQSFRIISNDSVPQGVPQGRAIGKWLSVHTTLHTLNLTQLGQLSNASRMIEAPLFGIGFSSQRLRFRAVPDKHRIPIDETIADAVEPDSLPFSDPSVSWTRILRTLGQRDYLNPLYPDDEENGFAFLHGLTLSEQRAALRRAFRDGSTNSTEVAVLSASSLERSCALELFTIFMLSLTSQISQVRGHTTKSMGPDGETWTNDILREMTLAVVQARLAVDEAEALTLIVPAFAARALLPTKLS